MIRLFGLSIQKKDRDLHRRQKNFIRQADLRSRRALLHSPFPGADQPHVVAIRSIADTGRVRALLDGAKNAVVIGGGVFGLGGGMGASQKQAERHRSGGQPADYGAAAGRRRCGHSGRNYEKAGESTSSLLPLCLESRATLCKLNDAKSFPADIVIISCGVKPNVEIAQAAGIYTEELLLSTNIWQPALTMYTPAGIAQNVPVSTTPWVRSCGDGQVAGASAAGDAMSYETVSGALTFNGMGTSLFALGDNGKQDKPYRTVEFRDDIRGSYEVVFPEQQTFRCNTHRRYIQMASLTTAIEEHAQFKDVIKF